MLSENTKKVLTVVAGAALTAVIAWGIYWLLTAAYHCAPNAEDFSLAIDPRDHGLIPSVVNLLTFYDSRYTANFLHGLNVLTFAGAQQFYLMPIICFVLLTLSFFYFITSLVNGKHTKLPLFGYSLMFVIVHYSLEPSLPYGLFYMASTFTYIYPWIFAFVWLGSLFRGFRYTNGTKKILVSLTGYSALILSYGSSELFIPFNAFFLFLLAVYAFIYNRQKLNCIFPYCVVALSCMLFIFLCPSGKLQSGRLFSGLAERYGQSGFVAEITKSYLHYFLHHVLHPLSICFIFVSALFFSRLRVTEKMHFYPKPFVAPVLFFAFAIMSYASVWVWFIPLGWSGDFPVYIFNAVSFLSQIGMYLLLPFYLLQRFPSAFSEKSSPLFASAAAGLMLLLILYTDNNISLIRTEYTKGYLQDVKTKADKFYNDVATAKESGVEHTIVYFQNPKVIPQSIMIRNDVLPNRTSACWNIAYEDYFGIDEVRLEGDTVFK